MTLEAQLEASIKMVEDKKPKKIHRNAFICKWCGKDTFLKSELRLEKRKEIHKILECGHVIIEKIIAKEWPESRDAFWKTLFPFQQTGLEFIEHSNFNCLLADEMGMGKTRQAIAAIRYNFEALTPLLIVCPAGLVYNWQKELRIALNGKLDKLENKPVIHTGGILQLDDGQNIHIISNALLAKETVLNSIINYGFKCIIADESHSFKNEDSARTTALIQIARNVQHRILLSGTPIMNKITEYFTTLNLIRPDHWPTRSYLTRFVDYDSKGKPLAISERYRNWFFERTGEYIIRRMKKDHLKDLPEKRTNYLPINVNQDKMFVKSYNKTLDELEEKINSLSSSTGFMQIIAIMSRLRHIVGLAKIRTTVGLVREFMESTEPDQKLALGVHHVDVRELLAEALSEYHPIQMSDESAMVKDAKTEEFRKPHNRLLIASILGCGEGRNLQFCSNSIIVERQWNPAKEDQFEGRFHRIGTKEGVIIDYLLASETIDEFFNDMVQLKRQIVGSTLDKDFATDHQFIRDLAEQVVKKRMKWVG